MTTGNNYLLDSNIVIEIFNGNKTFADRVSTEKKLYLPCIVLGELYTGANRVLDRSKHLKMLTDFLKFCVVINIDSSTAKYYGEMIATLYKKGKPIPTNDAWIAAIALQHGFTLITNDKHFEEVPDLKMINWKGEREI